MLHKSNTILSIVALMLMLPINANAANDNMINVTHNTPLIDGRCDADEWQTATKIALPAQTEVYLMHNNDALFVCAKGKANDYTVIDLYIEDADTGKLYNLHASAQLTERVFVDKKWSESVFWNHKDWSGFWVPYAGEKETEEGKRTLFLEGSHREIQVLRKKFPHKRWQMMFRISAVNHNGKYGAEFFYPQQAKDTDKSTWAKFTFAQ